MSYAKVTVAVLIVLEILIVLGAAALALHSIDGNSAALIDDLEVGGEPGVAPLLFSNPPDLAGIDSWLRLMESNGIVAGERHLQIGPTAVELIKDGTQLLVIDRQGRLLGAAKQTQALSAPESLDSTALAIPGLARMVSDALAGKPSATRTLDWPLPDRVTATIPVQDKSGAVAGVLVFSADYHPVELVVDVVGSRVVGLALGIVGLGAVISIISGYVAARHITRRLDLMSAAALSWGNGDFTAAVLDPSEDELGQFARALNRMAEQVADVIAARQQLSIVDERNRLARDLHDSVKQQAFAVAMNLGAARELWDRNPESARERLDLAYEIARQTQEELTTIIHTLRPVELAGKSIEQALSGYLAEWQARTAIPAQLTVSGAGTLADPVEDAFFRVAQEALSNVARHSGASSVRVAVSLAADGARLDVSDDGHGFDLRRQRPGVGLQSMRERIEAIGGALDVHSGPVGTTISARAGFEE